MRSEMSIVMPACGYDMWNASCVLRFRKSTTPRPVACSSPTCGRPDIVMVYAVRAVPASWVAAADSAISASFCVGAGPVGVVDA